MKKLLLVMLSLLIGSAMMAQSRTTLFEEHIDGTSMPAGWNIMGAGQNNWSVSPTNVAGGDANELLLSYAPTFNSTSRLVLPAVDLTGYESVVFSFRHYLDNYSGGHILGIATTSDNGVTWNQGWQQNYSSDGGHLVAEQITTPDMGKENVRFCVYYTGNSYNIDAWYFDDFEIFTMENADLKLTKVLVPSIVANGAPTNVGFEVINHGSSQAIMVEASYQVNDEEPVSQIFATNLSSLGSATLQFDTPFQVLPGSYQLKVNILKMNNAEDDDATNNEKVVNFACAYGNTDRIPMIEHFSSSSCPPCVAVNTMMNTFFSNNVDRFGYVKYSMNWPGNGDPYYTQEGNVRRGYYGVSAVPDLYIDGVQRSSSGFQGSFNNAAAIPAYADIRGLYTIEGNVVHISFDVMSYVAMENVRMYVIVNEKETKNNIGGNGETSFHHVMMKMIPDAYGTTLTLDGCETRHFDFTQDMSATHVEEMSDLEVVVFLQNNGSREVYNSHFLNNGGDYPAPVENLMVTVEDNRETGVATASWDAPAGVTPLGYKVILNGEVVEELTTNLSYSFDIEDGEFSVIEVQAIYDGYTSVMAASSVNYVWSTAENSNVKCQLMPNPANGQVHIFANENLTEVRVYNTLGMLVSTVKANGSNQNLDVTKLANGIYYVQMDTESGATTTQRLVVSH